MKKFLIIAIGIIIGIALTLLSSKMIEGIINNEREASSLERCVGAIERVADEEAKQTILMKGAK